MAGPGRGAGLLEAPRGGCRGETTGAARRPARLWQALFLLMGAALVVGFAFVKPMHEGDGFEYFYMLQAWADHGTPDMRPEDTSAAVPILQENGLWTPRHDAFRYAGFFEARPGRWISWHFWMYPLVALPAKLLLQLTGGNEFAAFQVTNALLFLLALWVALFRSTARASRRLAFAGLAAIGPVVWYLRWPHPEVFTWAFVVISLVLLHDRRYAGAALCASLAAMQNPPVLFLALYAALLPLLARERRQALLAGGAALLSFLPNVYYYLLFGVPSLIATRGLADARLVSWERTCSLFMDLNQGMLAYVPLLLGLAVYSLARAAVARRGSPLMLAAVLLLMVLASETTATWNHGCAGMMRYAVWMVPLVAWITVQALPATVSASRWVVAAAALQLGVVGHFQDRYAFLTPAGDPIPWLAQTRLAAFVLERAPALYDPEPEIFCERQLHREYDLRAVRPTPVAYVAPGGIVTKLLVDAESLPRLTRMFRIDASYLQELERRYRGRRGLFYVTPPRGAVQVPSESAGKKNPLSCAKGLWRAGTGTGGTRGEPR